MGKKISAHGNERIKFMKTVHVIIDPCSGGAGYRYGIYYLLAASHAIAAIEAFIAGTAA